MRATGACVRRVSRPNQRKALIRISNRSRPQCNQEVVDQIALEVD